MAFGLAAYASRYSLRRTALDSLPAADQALPDGLSTRKDSDERFQFHFIKTSPFLELLDATDTQRLRNVLPGRALLSTNPKRHELTVIKKSSWASAPLGYPRATDIPR